MSSQPFWVDGVFWGIVGLIGTAITIIFEMRKSRGMFNNILEFLSGSTQSGVDEKISMIYNYAMTISAWKNMNTELMISRITSDVNSVARVRNKITWDQWRELHRALLKLTEAMKSEDMNTLEIDAIREALK
jgi:hypothetical protein